MAPIEGEKRIEVLRRKALVLKSGNELLLEKIVELRKRILELEQASPERTQQELVLLEKELTKVRAELDVSLAAAESEDVPKKRERAAKKPGHGPRPQAELPTEPVTHDLDEADRKCKNCNGVLEPWDGHDDESEEITLVERKFFIRKHCRKKRRCKCGSIEMPDLDPRVVPGGRYSNEFALEVAAMKFVDQIPFDRIARIFGREGLIIDSQTLWDQVNALGRHLAPAWVRSRDEAFGRGLIGIDQTHWKVIGSGKIWQMWEISTAEIAYFDIAESKSTEDGGRILKGFAGTVVCDAFSTHGALGRLAGIQLAHCWAHPFRAAEAAMNTDRVRAETLLHFIGDLYAIDKESGDDLENRRVLRDTKSREVVRKLWEWKSTQRVLTTAPMGKLLAYLENHKVGFQRFLDDPRIPLDNNQTERGYLWPAIGRRSFVGSKSKRGTEVAAVFYSLAESARRNGLDPKTYLRQAMQAALEKTTIPLPHELRAQAPKSTPPSTSVSMPAT